MTKLTIELAQIPPVIADSARLVLVAHGMRICMPNGRELSPDENEAIFSEIGRNAAQALCALDPAQAGDERPVHVYLNGEVVDALDRVAHKRDTSTDKLIDELLNAALDKAGAQ